MVQVTYRRSHASLYFLISLLFKKKQKHLSSVIANSVGRRLTFDCRYYRTSGLLRALLNFLLSNYAAITSEKLSEPRSLWPSSFAYSKDKMKNTVNLTYLTNVADNSTFTVAKYLTTATTLQFVSEMKLCFLICLWRV